MSFSKGVVSVHEWSSSTPHAVVKKPTIAVTYQLNDYIYIYIYKFEKLAKN